MGRRFIIKENISSDSLPNNYVIEGIEIEIEREYVPEGKTIVERLIDLYVETIKKEGKVNQVT